MARSRLKHFLSNRWARIGLACIALGWGPLFGIVLLAELGLWPDPDPNPIGPGLVFAVSFWPALICVGVGWFQTRRGARATAEAPQEHQPSAARPLARWIARGALVACGVFVATRGVLAFRSGDSGRPAASALVVGLVLIACALTGKLPPGLRR